LPIILEFENTNIMKKDKIILKTDWSKYLDKTDKWKIKYNFNSTYKINSCITKMQKFMHSALKDSSIRYFCS